MSDIFISYSSHDRPFADRIAEDLQASGFSVFYDRELLPGEDFMERLDDELRKASFVLVLLSPAYVSSKWATRELELVAVSEAEAGPRILPALIERVEVPPYLRGRFYADLTTDFDAGVAHIKKAIEAKGRLTRSSRSESRSATRSSVGATMIGLILTGFSTVLALVDVRTSLGKSELRFVAVILISLVASALVGAIAIYLSKRRKQGPARVIASSIRHAYLEALDQSRLNPTKSSQNGY